MNNLAIEDVSAFATAVAMRATVPPETPLEQRLERTFYLVVSDRGTHLLVNGILLPPHRDMTEGDAVFEAAKYPDTRAVYRVNLIAATVTDVSRDVAMAWWKILVGDGHAPTDPCPPFIRRYLSTAQMWAEVVEGGA